MNVPDPELPAYPEPSQSERDALADAAKAIDAAALKHARDAFLGEERSYTFDQEKGALTLRHGDRDTYQLSGEVIGSFRPQDRSFRWAWANANVDPEISRTSASARDTLGSDDLYRLPTFHATYEQSKALAARCAVLAGLDGLYRAVTDEHLSVFVGYMLPEQRLRGAATTVDAPSALREAIELVARYDAAMFPIDRHAHERNEAAGASIDLDALRSAVAEKRAVHERFWHDPDGEWTPDSTDWPSGHDRAERLRRIALPRRAGGVYVVTQGRAGYDALILDRIDGEWRITDHDLQWGKGLPLLSAAEVSIRSGT